jgi:hypothetical protein
MSGLGLLHLNRASSDLNRLATSDGLPAAKTKTGMNLTEGQIGGLATAAGGLAGIIAGATGRGSINRDIESAKQNVENIKASQPSIATPSAYYDAVKNAYDQRLMQMRTQDINRSLATTTQAAQQYGSRGLGAVMQAQQQAQQQMRTEAATQQQAQTQAMMNLGQAEQMTQQMQDTQYGRNLEYAYDEKSLAEARLDNKKQQLASGVAGVLEGAAKFSIGLMKEGGMVQKTPGEFNHDTNEMYVVDENGRDMNIALTGGEYVINPRDAKKLKEMAGDGKTSLHRFVNKLVTRFEKADDNG